MAPHENQTEPNPITTKPRSIELNFNVTGFPTVKADHFRPVLPETMNLSLHSRPDGTFYLSRITLRGAVAKLDGTPGNAPGNLWFSPDSEPDKVPAWLLDFANQQCAPYLTTAPMQTDNDMTDEELWNSPLGLRLRRYADKRLLAEGERIQLVAKRQWEGHVRGGVERARAIVSPDGDPSPLSYGFTGEIMRPDTDPWADWQSPEVVGLREAIKATDGTINAAQEAAKAYIASLQGEERPAADEFPPEEYDMPVGPPMGSSKPSGAVAKREATPLDVAGALSYLLTGNPASDRGPFAVHDADGFHDEPYVILPVESMRKVLDEIPESRW